jgi:predicted lipoprotein with Yx(FWY)xxD motif
MKRIAVMVLAGVLLGAGCGGGDDDGQADGGTPAPSNAGSSETTPEKRANSGTTIVVGDSEFGTMLFDSKKQAIYIFENDRDGRSNCYDECAEAWPPVLTRGEPEAGTGADASLLGTAKRRDGRLQVTYAGKPLYFYAHEGPGEVRCHNVNLNGGFWWVVGPDGERRA